jgi:hypothetical protein
LLTISFCGQLQDLLYLLCWKTNNLTTISFDQKPTATEISCISSFSKTECKASACCSSVPADLIALMIALHALDFATCAALFRATLWLSVLFKLEGF